MAGIKDIIKDIKINNKEDADAVDVVKDRSKIVALPLNKIQDNPLNTIYSDSDSEEELIGLANSIEAIGLQQPISVSKANENYIIISGHRRIKAIRRLFGENKEVLYNGIRVSKNSIPVIVLYEYKSELEQFKALIASNNYRRITKETNEKKIEKAIEIMQGRFSEFVDEPGKTRDIIGKLAGVSGRTVQRYADLSDKENIKMKEKAEDDFFQKEYKRFVSSEKHYTDVDFKSLNSDQKNKILEVAIPAINAMLQSLDIDQEVNHV